MSTLTETFQDIEARLEKMFEDAVSESISDSDPSAVNNYSLYSWTFRVTGVTPGRPAGTGQYADILQIAALLKVGPLGAGYEGALTYLLQFQFIPDTLTYFRKRRNLVYVAGTRPPDNMGGALTISNQGLRVTPQNDDQQQLEWTTQFTLAVPINTEQELCHA